MSRKPEPDLFQSPSLKPEPGKANPVIENKNAGTRPRISFGILQVKIAGKKYKFRQTRDGIIVRRHYDRHEATISFEKLVDGLDGQWVLALADIVKKRTGNCETMSKFKMCRSFAGRLYFGFVSGLSKHLSRRLVCRRIDCRHHLDFGEAFLKIFHAAKSRNDESGAGVENV